MTTINVQSLFSVQTIALIFDRGIQVARALGLPVTSWQTGDPTRSLYMYLAEVLNSLEGQVSEYIKAGFLSSATGQWLKVLAKEVFGVDFLEATFGTPTITITNTLGKFYVFGVGDLTVKNTATGKTYHSTSVALDPTTRAPIGPLSFGVTALFELTADEAGSDSNAAANEIDAFVTTFLGLAIVSSTASIGQDEQSEDDLKTQCRSTLGALSPNGPADAYEYVARNPTLTGVLEVTRAKATQDGTTGDVTVFIASASGAVSGGSVTAVQDAEEQWATPFCVTPTVVSATAVPVNIVAVLEGDNIPSGFAAKATAELARMFKGLDIAGELGLTLDPTTITTAIRNAIPESTGFASYTPNTPINFTLGQVPTLGTVGITD